MFITQPLSPDKISVSFRGGLNMQFPHSHGANVGTELTSVHHQIFKTTLVLHEISCLKYRTFLSFLTRIKG
jgi:hypothetical protein